ncbi:uncharacterized protein PFLUO_LOCUS4578 [Penicillium psychrofluorescens]|uniref:uncharacterized protein n=1 Tax=Penicillium psychrofluorescens TaxID=3158075 RepID=UPI003CCD7A86
MSAPTISRLSPNSGPIGTTVLITGSNLASGTVTFGGVTATVLSNTPTSIFVTAPTGTGTVPVVVTTTAGSSTQLVNFTYTTAATPVISTLFPTSGPVSGGNLVTISGNNLLYTTGVSFGAAAASSFAVLSNTQVAAVAPAGAAGSATVNVTNPTGTSNNLTYTYIAAPTVTGLTPAAGSESGGNTVTITGTGFNGTTGVTFNGTPATSFAIISPTVITAVAPAGVGAGPIVVTTSGGPSATSSASNYTYSSGPVATTATPSTGSTAGGDTITITGSGLAGTTSVNFGTTPGTITSVSDTSVGVITPSSVAGTVPLNITTTSGTNSSLSFSFVPPPVLTSITPTSGSTAGGTVLSITGQNLASTSGVFFVSPTTVLPAASFTVNSDLSVTATSPPAAAGNYSVEVVTAAGLSNGVSYTFM